MNEIKEIIDKYEVPKELQDAIWDAYTAGVKRGFIKGGISVLNDQITKPKAKAK